MQKLVAKSEAEKSAEFLQKNLHTKVMQSCIKCNVPCGAIRRFGRQTFSTHHCIVLHKHTASEVNSAFYPPWDGKMSISFCAELRNASAMEISIFYYNKMMMIMMMMICHMSCCGSYEAIVVV